MPWHVGAEGTIEYREKGPGHVLTRFKIDSRSERVPMVCTMTTILYAPQLIVRKGTLAVASVLLRCAQIDAAGR